MEPSPIPRKTLVSEDEAKSKVPRGSYCYSTAHKGGMDMREYDRSLKQGFPDDFSSEFVAFCQETYPVHCPYWSSTDYGTVKCAYLGVEAVSISEGSWERAVKHFGSEAAAESACTGFLLGDAVKECSLNIPES